MTPRDFRLDFVHHGVWDTRDVCGLREVAVPDFTANVVSILADCHCRPSCRSVAESAEHPSTLGHPGLAGIAGLSLRSATRLVMLGGEVLMEELDGDGAFTDC